MSHSIFRFAMPRRRSGIVLLWLLFATSLSRASITECGQALSGFSRIPPDQSILRELGLTPTDLGRMFSDWYSGRIDFSAVVKYKRQIEEIHARNKGSRPAGSAPNSDSAEALLALIELANQTPGGEVLPIRRWLDQSSNRQRRQLAKALNSTASKRAEPLAALSRYDSRRLIGELLRLILPRSDPRWFASLSRILFTPSSADRLRQELTREVLNRRLVEMSRLLIGPRQDGALESFATWLSEHPSTIEGIHFLSLNTLSIGLYGFPLYFPRLHLLYEGGFAPEIVDRAIREGIDSVMPELTRRYGRLAAWERAVAASRRVAQLEFGLYWIWCMIPVLSENPELIDPEFYRFMLRAYYSKHQAPPTYRASGSPEQKRQEQFLSFRHSYALDADLEESLLPCPWEPDFDRRAKAIEGDYFEKATATWRRLRKQFVSTESKR